LYESLSYREDVMKTASKAPERPTAAKPSEAEGGVRAVDRALALLKAFEDEDGSLPLSELARRAGLHPTTALRLIGTLESHGFVQRLASGAYALGPELLVLGERFRRVLRLEEQVMPVLRRLCSESRESAAFFVREGDARRCLFRLESPLPVRTVARIGE